MSKSQETRKDLTSRRWTRKPIQGKFPFVEECFSDTQCPACQAYQDCEGTLEEAVQALKAAHSDLKRAAETLESHEKFRSEIWKNFKCSCNEQIEKASMTAQESNLHELCESQGNRLGFSTSVTERALQKQSVLASIPSDIFTMIATRYLDDVSKVILSISCKVFVNSPVLQVDKQGLSRCAKAMIMSKIERDNPFMNHWTCMMCKTRHRKSQFYDGKLFHIPDILERVLQSNEPSIRMCLLSAPRRTKDIQGSPARWECHNAEYCFHCGETPAGDIPAVSCACTCEYCPRPTVKVFIRYRPTLPRYAILDPHITFKVADDDTLYIQETDYGKQKPFSF